MENKNGFGCEPNAKRVKCNHKDKASGSSQRYSEYSEIGGFCDTISNANMDDIKSCEDRVWCRSDDSVSSVSDLSSDLSEFIDQPGISDESSWQPIAGPVSWVQRQMSIGADPRTILQDITDGQEIPCELDSLTLWRIILSLLAEPDKRDKLQHINTLDDVLLLLEKCSNIVVLTGAGISVSCGIPDFRSENGIYARLARDYPNLPDPQAMFDITFFKSDQRPFFDFAKEIYPGVFKPSLSHKFIKMLEEKGKLLRNYTQNIDTLERLAGIENLIECHGSFSTATCMVCKHRVNAEAIRDDIFNQVIPHCTQCEAQEELAIMKPDIVFFGESLSEAFHRQMAADKDKCDLLIVIGSSLKVRPVALIPCSLPADVPQILINCEMLKNFKFDVELLGDCDEILSQICKKLGPQWDELSYPGSMAEEVLHSTVFSKSSDVTHCDLDSGLDGRQQTCCKQSVLSDITGCCCGGTAIAVKHTEQSGCLSVSDGGNERNAVVALDPQPHHRPTDVLQTACVDDVCDEFQQACDNNEAINGMHSSGTAANADFNCLNEACSQSQNVGRRRRCGDRISALPPGDPVTVCPPCDPLHARHGRVVQPVTCRSLAHSKHHKSRPSRGPARIDFNQRYRENNSCCSHTDYSVEFCGRSSSDKYGNIASRLSENQYIFMSPNRYIFKGGMVFPDDEDDSENPSYGSPSASSSGSPIGSADTADFANPVKIVGDSSGSGATSTYTVSQSVT